MAPVHLEIFQGAVLFQSKWMLVAQFFSPNSAQDGQQVFRLAANFSVTKMQEENSIIQSPCFFELANKLVGHLMPN
jgi:hypothetical protein